MNEYIAALVDEFGQLGIEHAVFSPGSRSTTMAMLFEEHGAFRTYMNIDERSAAFMALGIAKAHRKPAILVCTSGSAVAHYLPAVLEAQHSGIPMIILSADRPHTLQHVGAPQTIDQQKLFGTAVNYYEELAVPQESHYYTYPRMVARKAYMKSMDIQHGPVHINVPLFEPLVPDLEPHHFERGRKTFSVIGPSGITPNLGVVDAAIKTEISLGDSQVKGSGGTAYNRRFLILGGPQIELEEGVYIFALAERLGAPVLMDPLSNLRRLTDISAHNGIASYDTFLKHNELWAQLKPDCVIQFGQMMVSKRVQQMLASWDDVEYIEVSKTMDYTNPVGTTTMHVQSTIPSFCETFLANLDVQNHQSPSHYQEPGHHQIDEHDGNRVTAEAYEPYVKMWKSLDKKTSAHVQSVAHETTCFEGRTIHELQQYMPKSGQIMIANSMSIRDFDTFWTGANRDTVLYGNRGVNGIDGTVSTALGLATNGKPTVLVTGDLTFFHDMNGLAVANTHDLNLTIILHNNDGGGIFEYLPVNGTKYFNRLFQTEQHIDYSGLAKMYGIHYVKIETPDIFAPTFTECMERKGISIIEIPTNKAYSRQLHGQYANITLEAEERV